MLSGGKLQLGGGLWAAAVLVGLCLAAPAHGAGPGVVSLPVSFQVRNTNTTALPCSAPDGAQYTVRGHITGPRTALEAASPGSITVYLTGLETGEFNWRFTAVPGYDWSAVLARLGQVSLTLDLLGYGASGHPWGGDVCYGTQADVAHQIVNDLRSGAYQVDGGPAREFRRVVLAGHDIGGAFAEIEAYTYHDVDGLVLVSWSDQGQTPFIVGRSVRAGTFCGEGGQAAYPGGPGEYFYMEQPDEYAPDHIFFNFDPAVLAAFLKLREPNPCGYELPIILASIALDQASLGQIHVPVLLAIGAEDPVWTEDRWRQQAKSFTGTDDVTAVRLPDTGHYPMYSRTAPQLQQLVGDWLSRHGVGDAPAQPPPSVVTIEPQTVTIASDRVARVRLGCAAPNGSPCTGALRLSPSIATGVWGFRVASGVTRIVRTRLSRSGYRFVVRRQRVSALAIASEGTGAVARAKITLRAQRRG